MRRSLAWILAPALGLAALAAAPSAARATTLFERSLDELAREADLVVVATPTAGRRSFWREGRIYTDVPVAVALVVVGRGPVAGLVVRLPGGVVGEVAQALPGGPTLDEGAPAVLFLSRARDGVRTVLGLSTGVLPLRATPGGDVVVAPARTEGLTLLPAPARVAAPAVVVPPQGDGLARFVARLRAVAR